jgi:hypothetical protein
MNNPKDNTKNEHQMPRKPYIKPTVEAVNLVLEEAVLGTGCKTATSGGPTDPCTVGFNSCVQDGS